MTPNVLLAVVVAVHVCLVVFLAWSYVRSRVSDGHLALSILGKLKAAGIVFAGDGVLAGEFSPVRPTPDELALFNRLGEP